MPAHKIVSDPQWEILLSYMESHPAFAKGSSTSSTQPAPFEKKTFSRGWEKLASCLNSVGTGCTKTPAQWRDYWNNIKYLARKKAYAIRQQLKGNDGPKRYLYLTKTEKRVLKILGLPIPGSHVRLKLSPPVSPSPVGEEHLKLSPAVSPSLDTQECLKLSPVTPLPVTVMLSTSPSGLSTLGAPPLATTPPVNPPSGSPPRVSLSPVSLPPVSSPPLKLESVKLQHTRPTWAGGTGQKGRPAASSAPEWVRQIEERRIAIEEMSARALQGIQANTEYCASTLRGIQLSYEQLNKTLQGIQTALELTARTLQERHK